MDASNATPELFLALSKAQGEIENASRSSDNPFFKSKYADLAEVLSKTRPVFSANGLSITQFPSFDGSLVSVTTVIGHSTGGYLTGTMSCMPAKTDAQGVGSATTYLRRYSVAAAAGMAQEDDDGNSAAHNKKPAPVAHSGRPTDGIWESFNEEEQAYLSGVALGIVEAFNVGAEEDAAAMFYTGNALDNEEKKGVWTQLPSKVRASLKKHKPS